MKHSKKIVFFQYESDDGYTWHCIEDRVDSYKGTDSQ